MPCARIFRSGRSQAVRLPKEFRFDVDEVRIRREGGALVLEPIGTDRDWLDALPGGVDAGMADVVNERAPPQMRKRRIAFPQEPLQGRCSLCATSKAEASPVNGLLRSRRSVHCLLLRRIEECGAVS
ncbi:MAG: AbrB/MazE/SpoVT family DNA-binding domain-containing protein [Dokdonella sp.]|nr:AbrB/MazE/SpoVT family DNA-binding domain-containing protein [Dokdonella sp.]